ncbi:MULTISPECIES: TIGR04086 family membrane protein [Kocuria]|uniref:TIGR04086 family membrane protein n=1 Tax=Kocuria subflava TaxID=1736139 RepID=A0A846TRY5_9MICC|nr:MULTISPECIES: TIGR04086 family membrane protein [Kocuria]NKE09720.1 TIGR04086 family membrane protein [Kocuria subflava]
MSTNNVPPNSSGNPGPRDGQDQNLGRTDGRDSWTGLNSHDRVEDKTTSGRGTANATERGESRTAGSHERHDDRRAGLDRNNSHDRAVRSDRDDRNDRHDHDDQRRAKPSWKEDVLGDGRGGDVKNISWGAVIAGVVTVLALTVLFSLVTAALGLGMSDLNSENPGEGVGMATGISSIITLALALFSGGAVAGLLAGRAGLIHGFLTWATSLLTALVLATLLAGNVLGALGNTLGTAADNVTAAVVQNPEAVQSPGVTTDEASAEAEQAVEDAAPRAEEAANTTAEAAGWTFAGLFLGAIVSAVAGLLGSRAVAAGRNRNEGVDRRNDDLNRRNTGTTRV